jgi:hypothetical protein
LCKALTATVDADNCLAKAATSRGKSQMTLRFAFSAPASTGAGKAPATAAQIPNSEQAAPSCRPGAPTNITAAATAAAAVDRAARRGSRASEKSAASVEAASPARKKGRSSSSSKWSSPASEDSDDWVPNRGPTASCRDGPSMAAPADTFAPSSPSASAEESGTVTFNSFAVGRRFHPVVKVTAGHTARLKAEPANARDPNALLVVTHSESPDGEQCLGYLPATVAAAFAPHLALGAISVLLTVVEPPKTPKASLPLKVQACHLICSKPSKACFTHLKLLLCSNETMMNACASGGCQYARCPGTIVTTHANENTVSSTLPMVHEFYSRIF